MASRPMQTPKGSLATRWAMARALRALPARGFVSQPEPRSIGQYAKGRQLIAGNALFGGQLVEVSNGSLWDIVQPDPGQADDIHGFSWLDDLAAVGDGLARLRAQGWLWDWIARFGNGRGPGWSPDLTGRRLIRWINHALFLLSGRDKAQSEAGGQLADVVVDATGHNKSMSQALGYCAFKGRLVYVGITQSEISFLQAPALHRRELDIRASRNALPGDFTRIIKLIEDGQIDTKPWITHHAAFDEMVEVFPSWTLPETGVIKAVVEV